MTLADELERLGAEVKMGGATAHSARGAILLLALDNLTAIIAALRAQDKGEPKP